MIKHFFILVFFGVASIFNLQAQNPYHIELSDSSYIFVITCDPGNQLYSGFGHSAIGVIDHEKKLAMVFNYGTFSFNTPNFYLKFAAGKLNYKLSLSSYKRFIEGYKSEGRKVIEDQLDLTQQQKQGLLDALMENYKPDNREYLYDFFFDNCATRILLKLEQVLGDNLVYVENQQLSNRTFRNLLDEYLKQGCWSDVGIDLVLGSVIDKVATEKQKAFLPDYLKDYLDRCMLNNNPLVKKSRIIEPDKINSRNPPFISTPPFVFLFTFFALLICTIIFRNYSWIIADRIIFSTIGLLGLIVFLMWFATDHTAAANNLNIIWANPLYLVYAFFINGKKNNVVKWGTPFFLITNILVLIFWKLIPQNYNVVFIPVIGILIIRLVIIFMRLRKTF